MSKLLQLNIHNIRNLQHVGLEPGPHFNVFCGDNGSGKTSLLEAIYYLGFGRSFRTRLHNRVINHQEQSCTVHAQIQHETTQLSVGVQKSRSGESQIKLSGEQVTLNTIADLLPLQLIYPDGHKLLNAGPQNRREFLDWGVFHVEHSFFQLWQRAQRALKQRNQVLKQTNVRYADVSVWDQELITVSPLIHEARKRFLEDLIPIISEMLDTMQLKFNLDINYFAGWDDQKELADIYKTVFPRDQQLGYTQYGPHKANISLKSSNKPAHDVLSQGQQKMVIYALKLSQSKLLHKIRNKPSIYLIDELPAELDQYKRKRLTALMADLSSQVFITGIEPESLQTFTETPGAKLFHVEHGQIKEQNCSHIA